MPDEPALTPAQPLPSRAPGREHKVLGITTRTSAATPLTAEQKAAARESGLGGDA